MDILAARTHDFVLGCYMFSLPESAVDSLAIIFEIDRKTQCRLKGNQVQLCMSAAPPGRRTNLLP